METQQIDLDKEAAKALHQQYREHQHYAEPIDREIQKAYRLISQGRVIIRALESIRLAGLNEQRLPKLAISRATDTRCDLRGRLDGSATFITGRAPRQRIDFLAGSFPGIYSSSQETRYREYSAMVPLIPIHLRPKQALVEYHILFEAEWRPIPPRDPMLLRRIGKADLWLVVAAWDLTDVEFAALSTRVTAQ